MQNRPNISKRIAELETIINAEAISEANGASQQYDDDGNVRFDFATCGECGTTWNDALITDRTPTPAARCPYEHIHAEIAELRTLRASKEWTHLEEPYSFVDRPLWWHTAGRQQTASGYGKQLTSALCVLLPDGRTRRVYVTIFSNAGTAWINLDGARRIVRNTR